MIQHCLTHVHAMTLRCLQFKNFLLHTPGLHAGLLKVWPVISHGLYILSSATVCNMRLLLKLLQFLRNEAYLADISCCAGIYCRHIYISLACKKQDELMKDV